MSIHNDDLVSYSVLITSLSRSLSSPLSLCISVCVCVCLSLPPSFFISLYCSCPFFLSYSLFLLSRCQGSERGVQAYHRPSSSPSVHGFLGAAELDRPLASLWSLVREPSKTHLLHLSVRSAWTRPLDGSTQLGESASHLPSGATDTGLSRLPYCSYLPLDGYKFQLLGTYMSTCLVNAIYTSLDKSVCVSVSPLSLSS